MTGNRRRDEINDLVQGLLDFGRVTASSVSSAINQVLVTIRGTEDAAGNEQRSGQALYGNAAVLLRPADPDSDGTAFEVVFARVGDEMVPVAHRETRWQVSLDAGEVVVRAFGTDAAKVRLKPDGEIVLEGTTIKAGENAQDGSANGRIVEAFIDGFLNATPVSSTPGDGGAALQTAARSAYEIAKAAGTASVESTVLKQE